MTQRLCCVATIVGALLTVSGMGVADVKPASLFGDNMVLQQAAPVPVWGTADAGEAVTVTAGTRKATATAGADGRWSLKLAPLTPGDPFDLTIAGKNTVVLHNVVVGEVWLCSGQSNMAMAVMNSNNAAAETASADYPMIRAFQTPSVTATEPQTTVNGVWSVCSPKIVGRYSAVGYFFGRELHQKLKVPVGLIFSHWGGTPAEAWTSRPVLEALPVYAPQLDRWNKLIAGYPAAREEYEKKRAEWQLASEQAKAEGKTPPRPPVQPAGPNSPSAPATLFNGMIAPHIPFAIKGVIWYQGESNAGRPAEYRELFPAMIRDWRTRWGQGDLPFFFVQLANYLARVDAPVQDGWADLREAQTMALALPHTGMAVTIDIGEAGDIHPKNKQDVGHRLALAALATEYGQAAPYSGPLYEAMAVEGNKVRLRFKHTDGGLKTKGDEKLLGFAIAGKDGKFVAATAQIEGATIIVSSDVVAEPASVRYNWANNPAGNLYNGADLPASPFRTDAPPNPNVAK